MRPLRVLDPVEQLMLNIEMTYSVPTVATSSFDIHDGMTIFLAIGACSEMVLQMAEKHWYCRIVIHAGETPQFAEGENGGVFGPATSTSQQLVWKPSRLLNEPVRH